MTVDLSLWYRGYDYEDGFQFVYRYFYNLYLDIGYSADLVSFWIRID